MFSYYGSKSKLAKYYPNPIYDKIIEPFCGAAFYSLFGDNWKKEVFLYDKSEVIVNLWNFLIQCQPNDILKLPDIECKENINNHKQLALEEKSLIYFCSNRGSARVYSIAGKYNSWNKKKIEIANNLYKIRHWKIELKDFEDIGDIKATYFIDPPYKFGGHRYYCSNKHIDFNKLAKWCKNRNGQVIVCENSKADWLPFRFLREISGQKHKTTEVIWTNDQ